MADYYTMEAMHHQILLEEDHEDRTSEHSRFKNVIRSEYSDKENDSDRPI